MNGAHVHLILNHIPILGSVFAFCLLAFGLLFRNQSVMKTGLVTLVVVALLAIPVLLSGEEAEHFVDGLPGVSSDKIETHEEHGEVSFWALIMSGAIALGTLLAGGFKKPPSKILAWLTLGFLVIATILMVRTGNSGGQIRHTEINATQPVGGDHDD